MQEREEGAEGAAEEYHIESRRDGAVEGGFEGVEVREDGVEEVRVGLGAVETEEAREEGEDDGERELRRVSDVGEGWCTGHGPGREGAK